MNQRGYTGKLQRALGEVPTPGRQKRVGFTGTQEGMTSVQRFMVGRLLDTLDPSFIHHGDCVGADAEVHDLAGELGIPVELHPPEDDAKRAFCAGARFENKPLPYLERNHVIVIATDTLVAAPKEDAEVVRSGTWATVRYARKAGRVVLVVRPDGTIVGWS